MLLSDNSYGKSDVRLTKVTRRDGVHTLQELTVTIMLRGSFDRVYTEGDNSLCIPTDTMKNTVYALAKTNDFDTPESFGLLLATHFLDRFAHVAFVDVEADETPWERIPVDGGAHPHAFSRAGWAARTSMVSAGRVGAPRVTGGIAGLEVIKTTRSSFSDFLKDPYTTLPETDDRIFATRIDATWAYESQAGVRPDTAERARDAILRTFAEHDSKSVQQTIWEMGKAMLSALPEIASVSLTMPNQHRIPVNLTPFSMTNANEIFVATSEPYGLIKGTVARR